MGILGRISGNMPFRGQRSSAPTPQASGSKLPPGPPVRKKPTGGPPPISSRSQAGVERDAIQLKIMSTRMTADQHRINGAHASADLHYRKADEMESRLKQGAPQLDDKAMSQIRPSQHLRDNPGSGWGRY